MAGLEEARHQPSADVAGGTGHEDRADVLGVVGVGDHLLVHSLCLRGGMCRIRDSAAGEAPVMPISIEPSSRGGFVLACEMTFPLERDELFPFFADAGNLERITPPQLRFRILTPRPIEMAEGTLIDYRLRIRGVPVRWRSEIAAWEPPCRFVDRQLVGPYRWWHHEHLFLPHPQGTLVRDVVHYGVPGGRLVHGLLVRRELAGIFEFRSETLRSIFGGLEPAGDDAAGIPPAAAGSGAVGLTIGP